MKSTDIDAHFERVVGPLWQELRGGLWHSTPSHRFRGILETGDIRHNAALLDDEHRWAEDGTTCCRAMEGVSLFDFRDADWAWLLADGHERDPWHGFLRPPGSFAPVDCWISSIWVAVDREKLSGFVPIKRVGEYRRTAAGDALRTRWMTGIEACHKGSISLDACSRIVIVCAADSREFRSVNLHPIEQARTVVEAADADWRERFAEHYRVTGMPITERLAHQRHTATRKRRNNNSLDG
ncbi:hypothetical protein [Rhodospirillaceae bacterium SYSU D60014]|uniref:hypothetical protein n=1 Tax=Virgifigura deserti TaxID=2268457 RepID=UPI0013C5261B